MTNPEVDWKGHLGDVFAPGGALSASIDGYETRAGQVEMAEVVADVIDHGGDAILEADTGTGKSFAYLIPILLSGKKAIISTSTKALQDQLFKKDIPLLQKALQRAVKVRMLKGRSNYLCQHRFEDAMQTGLAKALFPMDRFIGSDLAKIEKFSRKTRDGDLNALDGKTSFNALQLVTSNHENCLGQDCSYYDNDCHYYRALNKAASADILVANHALLFSHAAHGIELLSRFDLCVFDEAHELVENIRKFFGTRLSVRDVLGAMEEFTTSLAESGQASPGKKSGGAKVAPDEVFGLVIAEATGHCERLEDLAKDLDGSVTKKKFLQKKDGKADYHGLGKALGKLGQSKVAAEWEGGRIAQWAMGVCDFLDSWLEDSENHLSWLESGRSTMTFHSTPLDVDRLFHDNFLSKYGTLLVSATLSFDGSLDYVSSQLGMGGATARVWPGAFDYGNNALMLVPEDLPMPREQESFVKECVRLAAELVKANKGHAFVLFATRANLRLASGLMQKTLGDRFKVLVQGDASPKKLLDEFKSNDGRNTVLMGTRTFWQGVDVKGKPLSLLVIDKIPFYNMKDPIYSAIEERLNDQDQSPFVKLQLPKASLLLKQAAGRLIRSASDKGVLVLCDPRLTNSGYGGKILGSLQPMRRAKGMGEALEFIRSI